MAAGNGRSAPLRSAPQSSNLGLKITFILSLLSVYLNYIYNPNATLEWIPDSSSFVSDSLFGPTTTTTSNCTLGVAASTEEQSRVSVIIPFAAYRKNSLLQAIYSVLNQTYPNVETIVVDASGNAKALELDEIFATSKRNYRHAVKILHVPIDKNTNTLAGTNRNRGIRAASGEYIALLDADDAWFPEKLTLQFQHAELYDLQFFGTDASIPPTCRYQNGTFTPWNMSSSSNYPVLFNGGTHKKILGAISKSQIRDGSTLPALLDLQLINWHNVAIASTVVIHKSLIEGAGYFSESKEFARGQDWELWKRILSKFPNERLGYYSHATAVYDCRCHGKEENKNSL